MVTEGNALLDSLDSALTVPSLKISCINAKHLSFRSFYLAIRNGVSVSSKDSWDMSN